MPEGLKPPLLFRPRTVMPKSGRPLDVVFPRGEMELILQEMADFGPVERFAEVGDRIMSPQGEVGFIETIEGEKEHVRLPSGEKVILNRQQRRAFDVEQGKLLQEAIDRTRTRLFTGLAEEEVAKKRQQMQEQAQAMQRELEQIRENARISAEYQRSMRPAGTRGEFKRKYLKGTSTEPSFDIFAPSGAPVPEPLKQRLSNIQMKPPENLPGAGAGVSRTLRQLRPDLFPQEVEQAPVAAEPFQPPAPLVEEPVVEGGHPPWLTENPGDRDLVNAMPDPPRPVFPSPHRIDHYTPEEHAYLLVAYQDAKTANLRQALAEAAGGNPRIMYDGNAVRVGVQHDSLEDVDADHIQHNAMRKALSLPDLPEWAKEEIRRELAKPPRKPNALLEYSRAPHRIQQPLLSPEEMATAPPSEAARRQLAVRFGGAQPEAVAPEEELPWFKRGKLPWIPVSVREALQLLEQKLASLDAAVPPEPAAAAADKPRRDQVRATIIEGFIQDTGFDPLSGPSEATLKEWHSEHSNLLRAIGAKGARNAVIRGDLSRKLGYDPLSQFREHRQPRVGDVLRLQNGQRIRVTNVEQGNVTFVPEDISHPHAPHVTVDASQLEQLQGRFRAIQPREAPAAIAPAVPESYELGVSKRQPKPTKKEAAIREYVRGGPAPGEEALAEQLRLPKMGRKMRKPEEPAPEPEPVSTPMATVVEEVPEWMRGKGWVSTGRAAGTRRFRFAPEPGTYLYQHSGPSERGKGKYYVVAPYKEWHAFVQGEGRSLTSSPEEAIPSTGGTEVTLHEIDPATMEVKKDYNGNPKTKRVPLVGRRGYSAWGRYQGKVGITTHFVTIVGKPYLKKVLKRRGVLEEEEPEVPVVEGGPSPDVPPGWKVEIVQTGPMVEEAIPQIRVRDEQGDVVLAMEGTREQLRDAIRKRGDEFSEVTELPEQIAKLPIPLVAGAWDLTAEQKKMIRDAYGAREGVSPVPGRFSQIQPTPPEKPARPWEEELAGLSPENLPYRASVSTSPSVREAQLKKGVITRRDVRFYEIGGLEPPFSAERDRDLQTILERGNIDGTVEELRRHDPQDVQSLVDLANGKIPEHLQYEYERQLRYNRQGLQEAGTYRRGGEKTLGRFFRTRTSMVGESEDMLSHVLSSIRNGQINFYMKAPGVSEAGISKERIASRFGERGELEKLIGTPHGMTATIFSYADRDYGAPVLAVRGPDGNILAEVQLTNDRLRDVVEAMRSGKAMPKETLDILKEGLTQSAREIAERTEGAGMEKSRLHYDYGHGSVELRSKEDLDKILKRWEKQTKQEQPTGIPEASPAFRDPRDRVLTVGTKIRQSSGNVYRIVGFDTDDPRMALLAGHRIVDQDASRRGNNGKLREDHRSNEEIIASQDYQRVSERLLRAYDYELPPAQPEPEPEPEPTLPSTRPGRNPFTASQQEAEARRRRRELYRKK